MKDNEIALQSQQLSEQTGNRQARALEQQGQAWSHLPDVVTGFQQAYARSQQIDQAAQAHQMDMAKGASSLALDELRRKQAMEELQWAGQLHTADMLDIQKQAALADLELRKAQTQKAIKDLHTDPLADDIIRMDPNDRDELIAAGMFMSPDGKFGESTKEQRDLAHARIAEREAKKLAYAKALQSQKDAAALERAQIAAQRKTSDKQYQAAQMRAETDSIQTELYTIGKDLETKGITPEQTATLLKRRDALRQALSKRNDSILGTQSAAGGAQDSFASRIINVLGRTKEQDQK